MTHDLDTDVLAPLLAIAESEAEGALRIAALDAATRFSLTHGAWQECAGIVRTIIASEPEGSPARRDALRLAVRIPLLSVRRHLREMAADPDLPDGDSVAAALDEAGDPSRIRPLLGRAKTDHGESFARLAATPVEEAGVAPADIPPLPQDPVPNAGLWRALLLARLGEFAPLDAVLESDPEPELFWGSPWTAYDAIAPMRPIPDGMREYLLGALARPRASERARMIQLIVWAATGVADAQGTPIREMEIAGTEGPARPAPPHSPTRSVRALLATGRLPTRLFDGTIPPDELELFAFVSSKRLAQLVKRIVVEGNKRARQLPSEMPATILLGNRIIDAIPIHAPVADWPVADLAVEQVRAERPALDDGQMAWLIARAPTDRLIQEVAGVVTPDLPLAERLRVLHLLGAAADHKAGRGGSPARGAGPGGGSPAGRAPLIDDMPRAAAKAPRGLPAAAAAPADAGAAAAGVEEERRVHAQILHNGQRRRTFVAGADNVIRCWIGLPEPERGAVAAGPIPQVKIPTDGLPLTVELCWGDQSDHKPLLLPPDRTARTGDCDLRLRVPEGEAYLGVELAFRYRGRAFEVVRVEAFVLAAGEPERPDHAVKVRVEMRRREVIELADSRTVDSTIIWGADSPSGTTAGAQRPASLRVFGGHGGKRYTLDSAGAAVTWLNETLFITEKSLVRRRAAAAQPGGEELLDADDAEVLALLRAMARHGAALYNQLEVQGFEDPGERVQLLNREPDEYVPLEFVYDRGYPADDAGLCQGWRAALQSDDRTCPVCSQTPLPPDRRSWAPVICPLGFWSLQKIIERLDPGATEEDAAVRLSVPRPDRRSLSIIDTTVFASSHRVPENERQTTWASLQRSFRSPTLANDWDQWKKALVRNPQLLLVLPHHDVEEALDYLEIGDGQLPATARRLNRDQLTELYVNPDRADPGPIVLLLGCQTGARTEVGYVAPGAALSATNTSIVVGTLAQILGRHAAPARTRAGQPAVAVDDPEADFGTVMRRVRRRMLANGYLMSLCLVALGDAEWRLTPRPAKPTACTGDHPHVSP
jgi:hypothetical protein